MNQRHQGFTVIELMVALTAGAMVVTAVYYLGTATTWHFQQQQRISQTQMSLRMAMEQLRNDLGRAGFLGTPNSRTDQRCVVPANEIQAIEFDDGADTASLPNAATNGVEADRVRLIGNYATSEAYLAVGLDSGGSRVYLQKNWQGFRRSFGDPMSASTFAEVFAAGRVLHMRTLQNNHFFLRITGSDAATASVSFTPSLTVGGHCVVGLGDGAIIAPLSRIEYLTTDLSATAVGANLDAAFGTADATRGLVASDLVRREIAFPGGAAGGDATTTAQRAVLEFVAEVDYQFVFDRGAGGAPNFVRLAGADAEAEFAVSPQTARSIIVRLSARTADHDPQFPWVARAAGEALTRYRVTDAVPGAARVRTLETEIFLPNLAYR